MLKKIITAINKNILAKFNLIIARPLSVSHTEPSINIYEKLDYTRVMTLNLITALISEKQINGEIAEVGVFKGSFSSLMSKCLPDKNVYLYDTFEGFDESFFKTEFEKNIQKSNINDFKNTSLELVLSIMPYKEKCIVRKGFFPESIVDQDRNEKFCLVSLDCDLYQPIYDGLTFFYPRIVKGGYILIHDYNSTLYKDCKTAVDKFCNENNITVVPISDGWGTAVIAI
jgi:O-methyltransferase